VDKLLSNGVIHFFMAEGRVYGIAWYKKHQWEELHNSAEDAGELEDTYEEWLDTAKEAEQRMKSVGLGVERVEVDVPEFLRWCEEQGTSNTASARSLYVAELLGRRGGRV
jgi:hypothetical protein